MYPMRIDTPEHLFNPFFLYSTKKVKQKMDSHLNLHCRSGLPLCLSGITHPLTFSQEMADHDLRREAMKKHKSRGRRVSHGDQEMGLQRNIGRAIREEEDLEIMLDVLSFILQLQQLPCSAKAA